MKKEVVVLVPPLTDILWAINSFWKSESQFALRVHDPVKSQISKSKQAAQIGLFFPKRQKVEYPGM